MKTILITLIFILSASVYSQIEPAKMWTKTYNSGLKDVAVKSAYDNEGNLYVAGYRSVSGTTSDSTARMIIIKYNTAGEMQWSKIFHSRLGRRTLVYGMDVDDSGNAIICGIADTSVYNLKRAVVIKYSPAGDTLWARYNGFTLYSWLYHDVETDASGDVYLAYELVVDIPMPSRTCYVLKYNSNGVFQWGSQSILNTTNPSIEINTFGSIFIGGVTSVGNVDIRIANFDNTGTQQWSVTYNSPTNATDTLLGLKSDPVTGDVVATGSSILTLGGTVEIQTIKFSSALGQVMWVKRTNGTATGGFNTINGLDISSTGDVYICGQFTNNATNLDGFLIKYSQAGNELYRKIYNYKGGATDEGFSSVAVNNSAEPVVLGYNNSVKNTFLHRYSSGGSLQWKYTYTDSLEVYDDMPVKVNCGSGGRIYTTVHYTNSTVKDINVTMFDNIAVNTTTICRNINKSIPYNTYIFDSIRVNTGGNRLVRMEITIDSLIHTKPKDLRIYLTTPQGWGRTLFMNSGPDISGQGLIGTVFSDTASKPIDSGSVTYTGYFMPRNPLEVFNSYNPDGEWILEIFDVNAPDSGRIYKWCMKITYEAPIGIQTIGNEIPMTYNLMQNYPNPFNPATNIKFAMPKGSNITLKVYDILGREVAELANEYKPQGNYLVDFNASGLASGVYFYRLETADYSDVKKMILVK